MQNLALKDVIRVNQPSSAYTRRCKVFWTEFGLDHSNTDETELVAMMLNALESAYTYVLHRVGYPTAEDVVSRNHRVIYLVVDTGRV